MKGFIRMVRDVSGVAYDVSSVTIINANAITSIQEGQAWKETIIGSTKLLEPSANDISGILLMNTIILGTDLSGLTIGDDNVARTAYSIALGKGADASGTGNFVYNDGTGNTLIFDSGGAGSASIIVNGTPISGGGGGGGTDTDVVVKGTAEASGVILAPIHSAEGSSQSAITELDPSKNPLMTKGMYWINEAQDKSDGWSYVAPMDISRTQLGVAALGGKLYAVGGYDDPTGVLNSAKVYDPIDNSWNPIASMNILRRSLGVAALGGKLYAVGGVGGPSWTAFLNSAEVYDPSDNSWNSMAPMNISRSGLGVAALGGKLYAVGGYTPDGGGAYLKSAEVYDPIDNSWNSIASMDISRNGCGVAALGGKLYAVGGYDGSTYLNSAEVYDPIDNSWNSIAPLQGILRRSLGVAALGGKLYAVGGQYPGGSGSGVLNLAEVYDPIDNSWNYIAPMDISRSSFGAAALGGKLYAVGGYDDSTYLNSVEVYDPSLVQMPQITHQGEDFYISHQRGGPKTFIIPHPEHEGKMLRHACLEAPTRGTNVYEYQITTTEDNQTTEIALPSYFKHINARARVYVSAGKGKEWSGKQGKVNDELTGVVVKTEKPGIFNIMVTGVRKDPQAVAYSASENIDMPIALKDIPKKN